MKAFWTIGLLVISNIFMTFAWYGHLKMKQTFSWFDSLPLIGVVAFSWSIAFFEYMFQVPANRIGFVENGGPFTLMQLKVMQEVITLIILPSLPRFSSRVKPCIGITWLHSCV